MAKRIMGLQYRKGKIKLNYIETKPEVYKAIQLTYPKVGYEQPEALDVLDPTPQP
ncbi:MAG: hypothetical protein J6T11_06655 [Bacteroidaceae bacterium]|nr:hypothetical protein [Bacteroidaceae bacterium]